MSMRPPNEPRDNDGDYPGDTGGNLGRYAFLSAPDDDVPIVSQAWRSDDPTAYNRDINNGPELAAVPQPQQTIPTGTGDGGM